MSEEGKKKEEREEEPKWLSKLTEKLDQISEGMKIIL